MSLSAQIEENGPLSAAPNVTEDTNPYLSVIEKLLPIIKKCYA